MAGAMVSLRASVAEAASTVRISRKVRNEAIMGPVLTPILGPGPRTAPGRRRGEWERCYSTRS